MWASNIIGNLFIVHWRGIRNLLLDLTRLRVRQLQAHIKQIARELEESSRAFATYMEGVNVVLRPEEIVSVPHIGSAEFVRHHTTTETLSKGLYDASHTLNIILKIQLELMDNQSLAFVKLPTTRSSNTLPAGVSSLRTTSTDLSQWTSLVEMMPGVFGRGSEGVSPSKNTEAFDIGIIRKGTAENLWANPMVWHRQICRLGSAANCMVNRTLSFGTDPHEQAYVYEIVNRAPLSVGKTRLAFVSLIHAIDCLGVYLGPHVIIDYFRGVLPIYQWQIDARIRDNFPREPVRARLGLRSMAFSEPVLRLGDDVSCVELPQELITTTETLPEGFIAGEDDEDPVQLIPFEAGDIVHLTHCCGKQFLDTTIKSLYVAQGGRLQCPMCRSPMICRQPGAPTHIFPHPPASSLVPDWVTRRDPRLEEELQATLISGNGRL